MSSTQADKEELARIRRVADMLCTGHASLRDRYLRRALWLDLAVLAGSTWLAALAFVDPEIGKRLTPMDWSAQIWIGLLSTAVFFLTLIQMKTNWKGLADAHERTFDIYAEVKREAGYLLAQEQIEDEAKARVLSRYDMASAIGIAMPEGEFLVHKRRHLTKVAISKHLDSHPGASILLLRLQMWWRDTFTRGSLG